MSLFEKRAKAIENKDAEGLIASLHDDFIHNAPSNREHHE